VTGSVRRVAPVLAVAIGFMIMLQGLLGLSMPDPFVLLIGALQAPPVLYLAAAVRVAIGTILVLAAPTSRAPLALRVLGWLIIVGGVLTPIIGVAFAESILAWWRQGGPIVVRVWAGVAFVLGIFIVYLTFPKSGDS
jgi:hypothetical protein